MYCMRLKSITKANTTIINNLMFIISIATVIVIIVIIIIIITITVVTIRIIIVFVKFAWRIC